MNDEFLLGREVNRSDFLTVEGAPRYARGQRSGEHIPHLIHREQLRRMIEEDPVLYQEMSSSRFRRSSYFPLETWYRDHLVRHGLGASYTGAYLLLNKATLCVGAPVSLGWRALDCMLERLLGHDRAGLWTALALFQYCLSVRPKFICLN